MGTFRNQEPNELLGALASALERSELAHKVKLARLTEIKGQRVQINLNLGHIPRLLLRLADVTNFFLPWMAQRPKRLPLTGLACKT